MSREGNPQEWLRAAERDRLTAQHLLTADHYEACAFYCQQAIEKLLKAIIVKQTNQRPPHIHSLRLLLEKIAEIDLTSEIIEIAANIDAYYVGARYPLDAVDPGKFVRPLAELAVQNTNEVFEWFLARISFDNR